MSRRIRIGNDAAKLDALISFAKRLQQFIAKYPGFENSAYTELIKKAWYNRGRYADPSTYVRVQPDEIEVHDISTAEWEPIPWTSPEEPSKVAVPDKPKKRRSYSPALEGVVEDQLVLDDLILFPFESLVVDLLILHDDDWLLGTRIEDSLSVSDNLNERAIAVFDELRLQDEMKTSAIVSDEAQLNDAVQQVLTSVAHVEDAFYLRDNVAVNKSITVADRLLIQDDVFRILHSRRTATDQLQADDNIFRMLQLSRSVSDDLRLDDVAKVPRYIRVSDALRLDERLYRNKSFSVEEQLRLAERLFVGVGRSIADILSFDDLIRLGRSARVEDQVALAEWLLRCRSQIVQEQLRLTDNVTSFTSVPVSDKLNLNDAVLQRLFISRLLSDALQGDDSTTQQLRLMRAVLDTLRLNDFVRFPLRVGEVADVLRTSDDPLGGARVAPHITQTVEERLRLDDNASMLFKGLRATIYDQLLLNDTVARRLQLSRLVWDTLRSNDAVDPSLQATIIVADSLRFADVLRVPLRVGTVSDALRINDDPLGGVRVAPHITQEINDILRSQDNTTAFLQPRVPLFNTLTENLRLNEYVTPRVPPPLVRWISMPEIIHLRDTAQVYRQPYPPLSKTLTENLRITDTVQGYSPSVPLFSELTEDVKMSDVVTGYMDTVHPTVFYFYLNQSAVYSNSRTVEVRDSYVDYETGTSGYTNNETGIVPALDSPAWINDYSAPGVEKYHIRNYTFSSDGAKTLYFWCKDNFNNISAVRTATIFIDTIAPTHSFAYTQLTTSSAPPWYRTVRAGYGQTNDVQLTSNSWNDPAPSSGMGYYVIGTSSSTPAPPPGGNWKTIAGDRFTCTASNGTHTIYGWIADNAGNISNRFTAGTIEIDNSGQSSITAMQLNNGFYIDPQGRRWRLVNYNTYSWSSSGPYYSYHPAIGTRAQMGYYEDVADIGPPVAGSPIYSAFITDNDYPANNPLIFNAAYDHYLFALNATNRLSDDYVLVTKEQLQDLSFTIIV